MDILKIKEISKSYGKNIILNEINLTCITGDIIGVFGRNGCGKSTLLQLIYGTVKADSIHIELNSKIIKPENVIPSKKIAYLPQNTFLPKGLKVREIIPIFYPDGNHQNIIFYSPHVGEISDTLIGKLSMGQLRYLELLLVGHLQHPFLMLDEPFSMIEPLFKEVIKGLLLEFKKTKGIILTDHYFEDVLEVSNKNYILKNTKLIEIKDKKDLVLHNYLKANH